MKQLAYYDGAFLPLDTYAVHLEDRGFQFGDGVFETIRVYGGKCFALEEHLERYRRSMRELAIPITDADAELVGVFYELIEKAEIADGVIYFQLTRGTSPRSYLPPKINLPHLSVVIRDVPIHTDWQENGIRAALVEDIRWLRCDVLSLNLLGSVLAADQARKAGAKAAIFCRKDGDVVTEGHNANFFLVKDGVLWTHPADNLILNGVTRALIREKLAPALNLTVVEKKFSPDFVLKAEEAFLTSTADEIVPVTGLDRQPIGDGQPGETTRRLLAAYHDLVKAGVDMDEED